MQRKCCFAPIDSNVEVGPALPIPICRENDDAMHNKRDPHIPYTAQTGLPYFDPASMITIGSWYYDSALIPMGGHPSFRCRLVKIGSIYKQ